MTTPPGVEGKVVTHSFFENPIKWSICKWCCGNQQPKETSEAAFDLPIALDITDLLTQIQNRQAGATYQAQPLVSVGLSLDLDGTFNLTVNRGDGDNSTETTVILGDGFQNQSIPTLIEDLDTLLIQNSLDERIEANSLVDSWALPANETADIEDHADYIDESGPYLS